MFQGAWAIKAPGAFKRIPLKFAAFAAYKKREAWWMGVASSIVGLISACLLATTRQSMVTDAFASSLRWQGLPSAVVLIGLLFI